MRAVGLPCLALQVMSKEERHSMGLVRSLTLGGRGFGIRGHGVLLDYVRTWKPVSVEMEVGGDDIEWHNGQQTGRCKKERDVLKWYVGLHGNRGRQ